MIVVKARKILQIRKIICKDCERNVFNEKMLYFHEDLRK